MNAWTILSCATLSAAVLVGCQDKTMSSNPDKGMASPNGMETKGGMSTKTDGMPAGAEMVAEGGKVITYTAPRGGMIYIYDAESNAMLHSMPCKEGDKCMIDPITGKMMMGSQEMAMPMLKGKKVKVFFTPQTR